MASVGIDLLRHETRTCWKRVCSNAKLQSHSSRGTNERWLALNEQALTLAEPAVDGVGPFCQAL